MNATTSGRTNLAGKASAGRTWLRMDRETDALRRYRSAAGMVIAACYAWHAARSVSLLASTGLFDAQLVTVAVRSSWLGAGLSPIVVRGVFIAAIALALGVVAGIGARICAAGLFAISVATYWALVPVAYADDSALCGACLFLALLPTPPRSADGRGDGPVTGLTVLCLLGSVVVLYLSGKLGALSGVDPETDRAVSFAARLVAMCLLAPNASLVGLGVAGQVCLHAYLACTTPAVFLNVSLAATAPLFWGDPRGSPSSTRVDAGGALAAVLTGLWAIGLGTSAVGLPSIAARTRHVMIDLGLVPPNPTPSASSSGIFVVEFSRPGASRSDAREVRRYETSSARARLLAAHLGRDAASPFRDAIAARLAQRQCDGDRSGERDMWLWLPGQETPLAEFACDARGRLTAFRPTPDAPSDPHETRAIAIEHRFDDATHRSSEE